MIVIRTRPIRLKMRYAGLALFTVLLGLIAATFVIPAQAAPNHVVADLSEDLVEITSGYHGTELLLFGAYRGMPGDDLILEVRGPSTDLLQRRKEQKAGIWVNVETVKWMAVPSFYHLFSTRPLTEIAASEVLGDAGIGADTQGLRMAKAAILNNGHGSGDESATGAPVAGTSAQTEGLARNMTRMGLWSTKSGAVVTQQDMLYRTALSLPSNVPPGAYVIRVMHFRDGVAINESKTDMKVMKAGLSALIYRFAHNYSLFYGLFAIAFAVASGWLAAAAFRRG